MARHGNRLGCALVPLAGVLSMACQQTRPAPSTMSSAVTEAPSAVAEAPMADGGLDAGTSLFRRMCTEISPKALVPGEKTAVAARTRYRVAGTSFSVCVESTAYPLMPGKNGRRGPHALTAVFALEDGEEHEVFAPSPRQHVVWHGHTIVYGVARPSYASPGIWIRVDEGADGGG